MPTQAQLICAATQLHADILMGSDANFVASVAEDIASGLARQGDIHKAMQILKPLMPRVLSSMRNGAPLPFNRSAVGRVLKQPQPKLCPIALKAALRKLKPGIDIPHDDHRRLRFLSRKLGKAQSPAILQANAGVIRWASQVSGVPLQH